MRGFTIVLAVLGLLLLDSCCIAQEVEARVMRTPVRTVLQRLATRPAYGSSGTGYAVVRPVRRVFAPVSYGSSGSGYSATYSNTTYSGTWGTSTGISYGSSGR